MGVLERIEANFVHLSPKEQLLATYIMQESPYFTNITISEMAKETGVSAATITRFCRKVGCESFVDLKIQLQASEGESASNHQKHDHSTNVRITIRISAPSVNSSSLSGQPNHGLWDGILGVNGSGIGYSPFAYGTTSHERDGLTYDDYLQYGDTFQ